MVLLRTVVVIIIRLLFDIEDRVRNETFRERFDLHNHATSEIDRQARDRLTQVLGRRRADG